MAPKKSKKVLPAGKTTDLRFSNFETDPRFRLPSKRNNRTAIDSRFSRMLKDNDFTATAKVDRYGRKLRTDNKAKALRKLYKQEEEEEEHDDNDKDEDVEVEDDKVVARELEKADEKYDPARGGGFDTSESEPESDEESGEEAKLDDGVELESRPEMQRFRDEQKDVPAGEITNRIAIVNLDWDHVKSADLLALFSSFVPTGGRIERVSVYPSEFGKERMQREELEGPPKEIFKRAAEEDDDDDESEDDSEEDSDEEDGKEDEDEDEIVRQELLEEGDDQDFDSDALRTYQLDRLRYYYAVVVCSDNATAEKIYTATDGTEYLSSSNFLDLRFVPDDVTFDGDPRDECLEVPHGYKPNLDWVTDALSHSKVKLTWDMHPEEASRKESIKKAFTGSRNDIAENDLKAYLASDSEDDEDEEQPIAEEKIAEDEPQLSKKELARRKMRAALGLGDEPEPKASKPGPVGDMEITFTAALTDDSKDKKAPEETTVEKYMRKERERKEKKREKAKAKREEADVDGAAVEGKEDGEGPKEDLGFDDPFFTTEDPDAAKSKTAKRKEERGKKREAREAEAASTAAEKEQLRLLMDDGHEDREHLDHFDMNEIVRAQKKAAKKDRRKRKQGEGAGGDKDRGGLQEDFDMDVGDARFTAVFRDHEFAIDPSDPKFKATEGMKKLLDEGRKKRKAGGGDEDEGEGGGRREVRPKKARKQADARDGLDDLVASIKRKAKKSR